MASKIVIIGSAGGRLSVLFEKLSKLQLKNSFSFAIVAGDLFADPSTTSTGDNIELALLLDSTISVPLPVYFSIGRHALPSTVVERLEEANGEVCANLYFLGKRSTTKTSEGIRIVNLGGLLDPNINGGLSKDKYSPYHTEGDAKSLHGANTADILITSSWPSSIRTGSRIVTPEATGDPASEQCVAELCANLRPKYHFSTSHDLFYEREPFFHNASEIHPYARPITRFISLASLSSTTKAKSLYAFSLDPTAIPPQTLPPGTTASPLATTKKRSHPPEHGTAYSRFSTHSHHNQKRARHPLPPTPSECFFCLSNPALASHLITSIATDTYLTTAKGPLPTPHTYPPLPFPAHILIIPLIHTPTLGDIPDTGTYKEMQLYRSALHSMLTAKADCKLGSVTWEVSRTIGIHIHWQFLPVPCELIARELVEAAFKVEAENARYPLFIEKEIGDGASEKGDYFRVWIWRPGGHAEDATEVNEGSGVTSIKSTKGVEKSIVLPISASFRFDLQFGRRVIAKLLGLDTRANWRDCGQTEAEEVADAEAFRAAFTEFDFSLGE